LQQERGEGILGGYLVVFKWMSKRRDFAEDVAFYLSSALIAPKPTPI
jgi:hypothetical protein